MSEAVPWAAGQRPLPLPNLPICQNVFGMEVCGSLASVGGWYIRLKTEFRDRLSAGADRRNLPSAEGQVE
jgi:hypothetical protein